MLHTKPPSELPPKTQGRGRKVALSTGKSYQKPMQETQTFRGRSAGSRNRCKCDRMAGFIARARSELNMKGKWTVGKAWTVNSNRARLHTQGLLCNLPSG